MLKQIWNDPYEIEPKARRIKVILQMLIGVGIIIFIGLKLIGFITWARQFAFIDAIHKLQTLDIIGQALIVASAIELAYTLFTDGPDEAVDPLIMGLAATVLLGIAKIKHDSLKLAGEIAIYVAILIGLFFVRKKFVEPEIEKKKRQQRLKRRIQRRAKSGNERQGA